MTKEQRALALAILLPEGEHRQMKIGEALASMAKHVDNWLTTGDNDGLCRTWEPRR